MTFKYIAVPAGTNECPIPCRVHTTQRVEQMWAACPCPRLTRTLQPSGAEGEAGARRPPAAPPLSIPSSGRRLREPAVPGPGRARVRGGRGAQRPLPFSAPPRRARPGPARARALRESWWISSLCLSRGGLGRVLRRSDSEDRAEGLRPARPWAPPGAGVVCWAAALGQGTPPAAIALGADLVWGGGIVPIVDGRPVELVDQPMHRARPEAARLCLEMGESVNALAVALNADVSILPVAVGRERAGMRSAQWGPRGGDPVGEGRGGQGAPRLETGSSRRCPEAPSSPGCSLRGSMKQSVLPLRGEAQPVYGVPFSCASRAQVTIYI